MIFAVLLLRVAAYHFLLKTISATYDFMFYDGCADFRVTFWVVSRRFFYWFFKSLQICETFYHFLKFIELDWHLFFYLVFVNIIFSELRSVLSFSKINRTHIIWTQSIQIKKNITKLWIDDEIAGWLKFFFIALESGSVII